MYEQTVQEDTLFMILYGAATMLSTTACCYLLLRQGNAFAAHVKPPLRLRRWAALLFAMMTLSHLWFLPFFFLTSGSGAMLLLLLGSLLDSMTVFPLAMVVLLVMLQDRRRPLWPVGVMVSPLVAGLALCVFSRSLEFLPVLYGYLVLLGLGLAGYMVFALRRYGRWLRDNFADLEHKEVWQSFMVLGGLLLMFGVYAVSTKGRGGEYVLQLGDIVFVSCLLWRVETLSDLSIPHSKSLAEEPVASEEGWTGGAAPKGLTDNIGALLQQHCIDTRLYLQHDLTLVQLAKAVGTNRFYLSQYFSSQGMNYNAYINSLRVSHFVRLYREAAAGGHSVTITQLAQESGFKSYSTFSDAFKRKTGQSATAWIKAQQKGQGDGVE